MEMGFIRRVMYGNLIRVRRQVDLVVCCTRVDVHYGSVRPSIEMGKDVYVEWPLTSNLNEAIELNTLAKTTGSKTIIGLQGRYSPVVLRVKSLIEQGRIGKILGVSITAFDGTISRDPLSSGLKYFTQKSIGGNIITIGFGHSGYPGCVASPHLTALRRRCC